MNIIGNRHIQNNLRILLINNQRGEEFRINPDIENVIGDEADEFIAAARHNIGGAKNWAVANNFIYMSANTEGEFIKQIDDFCTKECCYPILFEVFTTNENEKEALMKIRSFNKNEKIDKSRIKTWFVTGASSGVGYEACSQLLAKGYNVVAVSRRLAHFEHPNVFCISADVSNMEAVDSAVRKGIERFGRVDVLFNNAGISSYGTIEEESLSEMHAVMDTNFWGTFNTMRLLIPHFRENNNGTIINNSSECGICARSFGAAYVSSKFAVDGLTSSARLECQNFVE